MHDDGTISVSMGEADFPQLRAMPVVSVRDGVDVRSWSATGVLMPNPHAVTWVDHVDEAGALRVASGR